MRVALRFRGSLAKKFQEGVIELELDPASSLLDLLSVVIKKEECVREVWDSPQAIDRDALILCNEADIGLNEGLGTKLSDGDVIMVLPLIHGG